MIGVLQQLRMARKMGAQEMVKVQWLHLLEDSLLEDFPCLSLQAKEMQQETKVPLSFQE